MTAVSIPGREAGKSAITASICAGALEIVDGGRQWRLWYLMGSSDMRRRYARSRLGQFWIMLSSAATISAIGVMWACLWQLPVQDMLPYVAVGMVTWQLLSGVLSEATVILVANGHFFLNQYVAASTVILSMIYRHGITFLLNLLFPLGLCLVLDPPRSAAVLLAIPGLVMLLIASFWLSFVIAVLCARFRDVVQIVTSLLAIAIFLTPVLWKPEMLPQGAQTFLLRNPFAALVSVVRDPLVGREVPFEVWTIVACISVGGFLLALPFVGNFGRRLVYWL